MKSYIEKRNYILKNLDYFNDKELLLELIDLNPSNIPSNIEIARVGLHKARLQVPTIPKKLKEKSIKWLLDRGYSLNID